MFRLLLNIYTHTAKIHGPFRVNHIGKDRTSCCQYFLVYIYGRSHLIECLDQPVKTFHVRWILSSNLSRLPSQ